MVVDVQNDFCPGGALAVPGGDSVVPILNKVISAFAAADLPNVITRDWHPANHSSIKAHGGAWRPHCVEGTPGAEIHRGIRRPPGSVLVSKGTAPDKEAYSGFQGTDLAERLRRLGTKEVYLGGLTIEYCVRTTAEDALREGFATHVILDCVKGLEIHQGDSAAALREMERAGVSKLKSSDAVALVGAQQ